MRKILLFCVPVFLAAMCLNLSLSAQTFVKQVIIVNGGVYEFSPPYNDYVTVASYDPATGVTTVFDTIRTQSVQDVVITDHYAFVSAEDSIVKYDIDTYQRLAIIEAQGVNMMSVYEDQLVVGFQWGTTDNIFVKVYNTADLSLLYDLPSVSDETFGITTTHDTAYVAVPGGWMSTTGKIAVIDLQTQTLVREMNLDSIGYGMRELFTNGNSLYAVNAGGWGSTSGYISSYNISSGTFEHDFVSMTFGNGYNLNGISMKSGVLYMMLNGSIGSFNLLSHQVADSSIISSSLTIAEVVCDTVNGWFYVTASDFAASGTGAIYTMNGAPVDSFDVGISAQAMAIDYRNLQHIENSIEANSRALVSPNPFTETLSLYLASEYPQEIFITDMTGRILLSQKTNPLQCMTTHDVSGFEKGMYLLCTRSVYGSSSVKIVKQ